MRILILAALASFSVATAGPAEAAEWVEAASMPIPTDYPLGARDVIQITVFGEVALSGRYVVTTEAELRMPELGLIQVGGRTKNELAAHIEELLRDGFLMRPQVTVQVLEHRSQRVDVTGAVEQPGEYYLEGPTSLLQMLSRAGGIETDKSIGEVRVRRQDGTEIVVNYTDLAASASGDVMLHAGDVVLVPEGQQVFIGGEVKQPGALLYAESLTVTQALTRVGGPSEFARLRGAYILRDGQRIVINFKRILDGRDANVSMQPDDQLYLRKSVF